MDIMIWLIILIICIVVEAATMGLTMVWFAGGSLVAAIAAALKAPGVVQIILFLVVSFLMVFFTRPIAVKYFNKGRAKTNVESIIGKQAIVTGEIDNLHGKGQVTVGGQEWSARSTIAERVIPEGAVVSVVAVSGVKLIVEEAEKMEECVK